MQLFRKFFEPEELVLDDDIFMSESFGDEDHVGSQWKQASLAVGVMVVVIVSLLALETKAPIAKPSAASLVTSK